MSKGVLFFAENNEQINYVQLAKMNSVLVKKYMNVPCSIVTDKQDDSLVDYFDQVIISTKSKKQKRRYIGFDQYELLSYYNSNRTKCYDITPYDETILLDVDYLIFDDSLNKCWESVEPIMMSKHAVDVLGNELDPDEKRLFETTIPMYWATAVYFKKSDYAEKFFTLVNHVQKNYKYFSKMYEVRSNIYRNDYAFSIAAHIFGDFSDNSVASMPDSTLLTSSVFDIIMKIREGSIELLARDKENGYQYPARVEQNVHIMNKFDLQKFSQEIIDVHK